MPVFGNMATATDPGNPWLSLTKHMSYVVQHLRVDRSLIRRLIDAGVLGLQDADELEKESTSQKKKVDRLLVEILPKRQPSLFTAFCKVLTDVGQGFIVQRILGNSDHVQKSVSRDEDLAHSARDEVMGHHVPDDLPSFDEAAAMGLPTWKQWDMSMPIGGWSYGRMVLLDGKLIVGGINGSVYIYTEIDNRWDTVSRENGFVSTIVCYEDLCLVVVKDDKKKQYEVERFFPNEDVKWRSVTVLPPEMQMVGVSVALHENCLFVVGGETESRERVNTARMFDLTSGQWMVLDDVPTKRSFASSCVVSDTVFVGGGEIGQSRLSNVVECYNLGSRRWRSIAVSRNYYTTLTSVSNRLVATGGMTTSTSSTPSNAVQLYDDRSAGWLPLPPMTKKRWGHGGFSADSGEIVMAGGDDANTIESLKID